MRKEDSLTESVTSEAKAELNGRKPAAALGPDARASLQQRLGQVVLAMMRARRYAGCSVADLERLALDPLLNDRAAIALGEHVHEVRGIALWASVSDFVHERLLEEARLARFPTLLARDEWRSGDNVWLLDILAPDRKAGTAVFMSFSTLTDGRGFRIHPVVLGALEPEMIGRFKEAVAGAVDNSAVSDSVPVSD